EHALGGGELAMSEKQLDVLNDVLREVAELEQDQRAKEREGAVMAVLPTRLENVEGKPGQQGQDPDRPQWQAEQRRTEDDRGGCERRHAKRFDAPLPVQQRGRNAL